MTRIKPREIAQARRFELPAETFAPVELFIEADPEPATIEKIGPRCRFLITPRTKCPVHVRCYALDGSGITAEAQDEDEDEARRKAWERCREIAGDAGIGWI